MLDYGTDAKINTKNDCKLKMSDLATGEGCCLDPSAPREQLSE